MPTKGEMEEILKKIPADELAAFQNHPYTRVNINGQITATWPRGNNLFDTLSQKLRYIVDSNLEWKNYAKNHSDKLFIVGKTLTDENENLKALFSNDIPYLNGNIFVLSIEHLDEPQISIEPIDEHYLKCLNNEQLEIISKKRTREADPAHQNYLREREEHVRAERSHTLQIMGINSLSDLTDSEHVNFLRLKLEHFIRTNARSCLGDWLKSCRVATHCHAYILTFPLKMKVSEFNDERKINVFGDTHILRDALFLQAGILTKDKELTEMAGYAGLECVPSFA